MDKTAAPHRTLCGRLLVALLAAAAVAPGGCTSWKDFKMHTTRFVHNTYDDPEAEKRMAEAEKLAESGDYKAAQKAFKILADNKHNNTALTERARYMQAECRRMLKEYPEAVATYNRLLQDYPTGSYRQQACARMFEISDYWLDDFRAEMEARKDEKGILIKQVSLPNVVDGTKPTFAIEDRALEALEQVHTHDITGPTADQSLFWCGYVNYIRGNFNEADHFFSQLIQLHKDSKYRPTAITLAIQAKNNSTGGPEYDGRKCAEALRLVHQAKGSVPEMQADPEMKAKLSKAELAIRAQQAEKILKRAEYYERTRHPGSAYFCYELLRRQHAGTKYSDLATARMDKLKHDLDVQLSKPEQHGTWDSIQGKWNDWFGREQPVEDGPAVPFVAKPGETNPMQNTPQRLPDPRALPSDLSPRP